MLFDRKPFIVPFRASTPSIVVIVLLAAVLCITLAYDRFYPAYLSNNWQSISGGEQQSLTAEVQSLFRKYQQESADATRRVAALPEVRAQLLKRDSLSQAALFALLLEPSGQDVSIQIFDGEKRLLAWAGPRGLDLTPDQIAGVDSSFVQDGPLYSYLIVSIPLAGRISIDGFVIGKRLIDVTYPINNRFINNEAFTSTFSSRFQIVPKFEFSGSPQKADSGLLAINLQGISGSTIGVAYLPRPGLASRLEESHDLARHILELELLAALLLLGGAVHRWRGGGGGGPRRQDCNTMDRALRPHLDQCSIRFVQVEHLRSDLFCIALRGRPCQIDRRPLPHIRLPSLERLSVRFVACTKPLPHGEGNQSGELGNATPPHHRSASFGPCRLFVPERVRSPGPERHVRFES